MDLPDWMQKHLDDYLRTNGEEGHMFDATAFGGGKIQTLILKTKGRKTGKDIMLPLIYGTHGKDYVLIASKGGAPEHPFWYLNLKAQPTVEIQVKEKCFETSWRIAEGAERRKIWDEMAKLYAPYSDYEKLAGEREIPVILLTPVKSLTSLRR